MPPKNASIPQASATIKQQASAISQQQASAISQQPRVIEKTPGGKTIGDLKMYFLNRILLNTTNVPFQNLIKNALTGICGKNFKDHVNNQFDHWSVLGFLTKCCKSETKGRGNRSHSNLTDDEELVGIVCLKKKGDTSLLAIPKKPNPTSDKDYIYKNVDIGIGGKDLYIDLLCAAKSYGRLTTSYVEKLARKYHYEKIVMNAVFNVIEFWEHLEFINLKTYYNVDGNLLKNEGVRMEKEIINNSKTVGDQDINDPDFKEIKSESELKLFFTQNVTTFGNPFLLKGGSDKTEIGLGLGATEDSESESGEDASESETDEDTSLLNPSVASPIQQIAPKGNLLNDIKAKKLPKLLANALFYTLFELEKSENENNVDFFVNLIQKDYNEPDENRHIYNGGEYFTRQEKLFGQSELGNMIRDSFRDNFAKDVTTLDDNWKVDSNTNKQDSDEKQMELFEQVMEKIKSPPNALKNYPFITRESAQMDRTFEYIKSQFAEYRQRLPAAL